MGLRVPSLQDLHRRSPLPVHPGTGQTRPVLDAKGVTRDFGPLRALGGIDLQLAAGEIVALVGPNGAGKSVLGRVLSGLVGQSSGEVRLSNRVMRADRRRRTVWYIGQDLDSQLFGESVLDELPTGHPQQDRLREKAVGSCAISGSRTWRTGTRRRCPAGRSSVSYSARR
nr:ATP-binding cassette domain-containing protein [uncultured Propionibacterium sp.]